MVGLNALEVIFISVSHSITLMGKVWLIVMILLRFLILLFAGYPLYQDEQDRFVCNTIQPGCANVCYDLFSPVSLFRFWLVQLITLSLPYVVFIVYVVHKVSNSLTVDLNATDPRKVTQLCDNREELFSKRFVKKSSLGAERRFARCFTGAYMLHLMVRTLLEAGFGAAHYYLFGFYIPRRFLCQHPPCTTQVDCYISRPTEKTVMLNFMLGVAALSFFLNVLDIICTIKCSVRQKSKRKMMVENTYEEEQGFHASGRIERNNSLTRQHLEAEAGHSGSFRKRRGSKGSCGGGAPCLEHTSLPQSPASLGCNTNGNNGHSVSQEEAPGMDGSEVALCPPEHSGTPRAIRVSKRSRLKPPPPPRRDLQCHSAGSAGPIGDNSTVICAKRVGQYPLVQLASGSELQTNDEGQEKRSEWV
ncbi:gap junction delta-4 protein [Aulostomus maculatus]